LRDRSAALSLPKLFPEHRIERGAEPAASGDRRVRMNVLGGDQSRSTEPCHERMKAHHGMIG